MKWKLATLAILVLSAVIGSGCSSTVALTYTPSSPRVAKYPTPTVAVGRFDDKRGEDSNYLGTIRGGYGNPLKRAYSAEPVDAAVAQAFRDALNVRGGLATDNPKYILSGDIIDLSGNEYMSYGAVAEIKVRLSDSAGKLVFDKTYKKESTEGGGGWGIFNSADKLGQLCVDNLGLLIDTVLDDPAFTGAAK